MARYLRVSLKGKLGASEVWSCSYVLDPFNEIPVDFDQAKNDAAAAAIGTITLGTTLKAALSTAANWNAVRLELHDTTVAGFLGASEYNLPTPVVGGNSPSQNTTVSVVLGMRGNTALASGRGRVYWPALGLVPMPATLRVLNTQTPLLATEWKTFLTASAVAAATAYGLTPPLDGFDPAIYSPTKKTLTKVATIRVGDVFDTQRRRRDAMPETYALVNM